MGIQDLIVVFDKLNPSKTGYTTLKQLHELLRSVYIEPILWGHIEAAVFQVCGSGSESKISRDALEMILEEVERRRALDEQAYWDFQALDYNGSHRIKLCDAFTLFRDYHGAYFSMHTWNRFLNSRVDLRNAGVSFDEIRSWLCDIPCGNPVGEPELHDEATRLNHIQWEHSQKIYETFRQLQIEEGQDQEEEEENKEMMRQNARKKLIKWHHEGIESMLDEGDLDTAMDDLLNKTIRRDVSASDLFDALDLKYQLLVEALALHMADFAANMDSERIELSQQIKRKIKALFRHGQMCNIESIPGVSALLPGTLAGMIGDLRPTHHQHMAELQALRERQAAEGKPVKDIERQMRTEYENIMKGTTTCGQALIDLKKRKTEEKELLVSSIRGERHGKWSYPPWLELCHLQRQHTILEENTDFCLASVAVGLAERPQTYRSSIPYDLDRKRSEQLAAKRLDVRLGHAALRATAWHPNLTDLEKSGVVNIRGMLVAEIEHQYHLEREALIGMLQGPDSEQTVSVAKGRSVEERRQRLTVLRGHRLNWKRSNLGNPEANIRILQEAVGLYWVERQHQLEREHHNMTDASVSATVLADLQQRQEVDFVGRLNEMSHKREDELIGLLEKECQIRCQEHLDNIAFMVLGVADLNAKEQEFIDALEEKYQAIRDQIIVFALRDKHGIVAWNSMGREERQRELHKLRKEEKRMRGDGCLHDMGALIGPKSLALPSLTSLLGHVKKYGNIPTASLVFKPQNLLADTVTRCDLEQEALLSWLKTEEVKSGARQNHKLLERICLDVERFVVGVDSDFEAGLMALGLFERISTVVDGKSKDDLERQQMLAAKRVALRKFRIQNEIMYKKPAEDKQQTRQGDSLGWQCALLRCVIRCQANERELLLHILQDPTFSDLVEAAVMIPAEERWHRQTDLFSKHQVLDLSATDGYEEHVSILEEAAALRVAGVQAAARRRSGHALSEDEVATALTKELQEQQDAELAQLLENILSMEEEMIQQRIKDEKQSCDEERAFSVMTVLSHIDGDMEVTDPFMKLVEAKYAVLRDLLMLALTEEQKGVNLTPKNVAKLMQRLHKQVVPLWDAGDAEAVANLLGHSRNLQMPLPWIFGTGRGTFAKQRDSAAKQQKLKEEMLSENTGVLLSVKHLMQRFSEEKDFILKILAGSSGQFLTENMKLTLKTRLRREVALISEEDNIITSALACGLAERQAVDIHDTQLEQDGERYRQLAQQEYASMKKNRDGKQKKEKMAVDHSQNKENLQDALLKLLHLKQHEERRLLVETFLASCFSHVQQMAGLESQQQRADRLATLRAKWEASTLDSSADSISLLQEALVVHCEDRRSCQGQESLDDDQLHCWLLADLLHLQNCEDEQYQRDFETEEIDDLIGHQEQIIREAIQNHCVNIAKMVFSGDLTQQHKGQVNPMIEALEGKYDALRSRLLIQALKKQIGENKWHNMSSEEQMKRLMELKMKEKKLRYDGKKDELEGLLGDDMNNEDTLNKLIGEKQENYHKELQSRLERRRQLVAEGMSEEECNRIEKEEEKREEEAARRCHCNVLQELDHNYQQECEKLLQLLGEDANASDREKQKHLLCLRLQQRQLRQEHNLETSAFLIQQYENALKGHKAERHRQEQLAFERLKAVQFTRHGEQSLLPSTPLPVDLSLLHLEWDKGRLQEVALTCLDLNQQAERELLTKLLKDWSAGGSHVKATEGLSPSDLLAQLEELREVFKRWQSSCRGSGQWVDEALQLLGEALTYAAEIKRQMSEQKKAPSGMDIQVSLMADLQEIQDGETCGLMAAVVDMDVDRLKQLIVSLTKSRHQGYHDNVTQALLHPAGVHQRESMSEDVEKGLTDSETTVVKALEFKYDALRDKIIIEALIKQLGDAEWHRMSELERQRRVVELRRKERKLRQEGKKEEIEALIGQHLKHKEYLSTMLGESIQGQKLQLKKRLARRQQLKAQREAAGLDAGDGMLDALVLEEEKDLKAGPKNILDDLEMHFEEEKEALLARLASGGSQADRENQRQQALIRLQQEQKHLEAEQNINGAVLMLALGSKTSADDTESLLEEREKHKQLALERLTQQQHGTRSHPADSLEKTVFGELDTSLEHGVSGLRHAQKDVLIALDNHHAQERDMLAQLLTRCRQDGANSKILQSVSSEGLRQKLARVEKEHAAMQYQSAKEFTALCYPHLSVWKHQKLEKKARQNRDARQNMLAQALASKLELERRQLVELCPDAEEDEIWEKLCVFALANLQERQMAIYNSTLEFVFSKDKETVIEIHRAQRAAECESWFQSLGGLVFSVSDVTGEWAVLDDFLATEAKLQEEFEQQKQAIIKKEKNEDVDVETILQQLQAEHEAKLKSLAASRNQQRSSLMQKLQAQRRHLEVDTQTALLLLNQAQSNFQNAQEMMVADRSHQNSLLEERLKQRREARMQAAAYSQQQDMGHADTGSSAASTSVARLRREKTLLDASVSDDQKKAIYRRLMDQQHKEESLRRAERERQKDKLNRLLEARKGRLEGEVAALFSLGERQKMSLEEAKKVERDRQTAHVREQLSRVRHERTMTHKNWLAGGAAGKAFSDLAEEEGDAKMEERAQQLQHRLNQQAQDNLTAEITPTESAGWLDEKTGMDLLKKRRRMKKQQRQDSK